jgi:hypothetical protein
MNYPPTEIDKIDLELHELAKDYASKAKDLASDPYFREAIMKVSVSGFVWALYHAFEDGQSRDALNHELKVQSATIDRMLEKSNKQNNLQ